VTFKGSAHADLQADKDDPTPFATSDVAAAAPAHINGYAPAAYAPVSAPAPAGYAPARTPAPPSAIDGDIAAMTGRIKAAVDFGERPRLLVGECDDGADSARVAEMLAHDLALRLEVPTILIFADPRSSDPYMKLETRIMLDGRMIRAGSTATPRLRVARMLRAEEPPIGALDLAGAGNRADARSREFADEMDRASAGCSASVIDIGPLRRNARWTGFAGPGDSVLLVVRYGVTRRDDLAAAASAIRQAGKSSGGVIMTRYRSDALDYINRKLSTLVKP